MWQYLKMKWLSFQIKAILIGRVIVDVVTSIFRRK
jgi:hypothetical protein